MTKGADDRAISRRDFFRLGRSERGKVLDVACQTMYMHCVNASIVFEPVEPWEPWMGEPPAQLDRRSVDDLLDGFERLLQDVQILRLRGPAWLESIPGAPRVRAAIAAFRDRGGKVDEVEGEN